MGSVFILLYKMLQEKNMLVPIAQVGEYLGVHRTTVYRWIENAGIQDKVEDGKVPFRLLLNWMHEARILPFKHTENATKKSIVSTKK